MSLQPSGCLAQWKLLLQSPNNNLFFTPYFLNFSSSLGIGFVVGFDSTIWAANNNIGEVVFKTTDGGYSWKEVQLGNGSGSQSATDITFKDSITGWLTTDDGVYKTSDQGNSWAFLLNSHSNATGIYYNKMTGGLFLATWGTYAFPNDFLVSWDEGSNWSPVTISEFAYSGFSFNNDSLGILSQDRGVFLFSWLRTKDGGKTWGTIAMDSECWQPFAIPGSLTQVAIADHSGEVFRSTDSGSTWSEIFAFPSSNIDGFGGSSSGTIRGDSTHLFIQNKIGCYMSTDQGDHWHYLCGVPSSFSMFDSRFYYKNGYIYLPTYDSVVGYSSLWMLNLDSLNLVSSNFAEQFANGAKQETIYPGDTVRVDYFSDTALGPEVGTDSVFLSISFDTSSLALARFELSPGWSILDSSHSGGNYRLLLVNSDSLALDSSTRILRADFASYLAIPSSKVYLDSVHYYGHRLNCDCAVQSVLAADTSTLATAIDSVEIDFTGCGDSTILAVMHHEPLFSIQSIVPNPAQNEVRLEGTGLSNVAMELYDVLGNLTTPRPLLEKEGEITLDVSPLPPGIYYLRFSSNGYVETRSISIQR
jgi:photosystem II stability/assembly factor-like uncharacterized protein